MPPIPLEDRDAGSRVSRHGRFPRVFPLALLLVLTGCAGGGAGPAPLKVSEVTLFGDLDCFKIETPTATYLYGKKGGGFASIVDPEGHDWVSYRPGGKAAGEYRGLPKCGQPVKYFHCGYGYGQYKSDLLFHTRIAFQGPDHVRLSSVTTDGTCACDWDFWPSFATLTLRKIALPSFWFLYEGTPGGVLESEQDFVLRPGGKRTSLSDPWEDRVAWTCFCSPRSPYGLFLINHDAQAEAASYVAWPYQKEPDGSFHQMTVFGWGRLGWQDPKQHQPQLRSLPACFSLAFVASPQEADLSRMAAEVTGRRS